MEKSSNKFKQKQLSFHASLDVILISSKSNRHIKNVIHPKEENLYEV